jgi:arylsulfatase A-like enzyme
MGRRSAVVVVVDRLGAGFLGPYGNTWLDTPHWNRLASESLLVETALADSADLGDAYRALWRGLHRLEPILEGEKPLAELAAAAGYETLLVSDNPAVIDYRDANAFATQVQIDTDHDAVGASTADDEALTDTQLGRLFAEAIGRVGELRSPALVWVHARGLSGPWDAPYAMRRRFADDEDPDPPDFVDPPRYDIAEGADPDELLGVVQAYAGQVTLVDAWLGALLEAIDSAAMTDANTGDTSASETLVIVTSPRGYPLGEHGRVGPHDDPAHDALYGELLQVPLLVRRPGGALSRTQRFGQLGDVAQTVADWLGLDMQSSGRMADSLLALAEPEESTHELKPRQIALAVCANQRMVRTPAWMWRESNLASAGHESQHELFAKPDDRWEANEVASRCREVVEQLSAAVAAFEQAAKTRSLDRLEPLDEELVAPVR